MLAFLVISYHAETLQIRIHWPNVTFCHFPEFHSEMKWYTRALQVRICLKAYCFRLWRQIWNKNFMRKISLFVRIWGQMFQFPRNHFLVKPVRLLSWGRFTRSNFFIQLFFSPLFKTTIGCVNANFSQVSDIFYVLDENRTCSISIRLDQKSRQFLTFPRSILQNIFTKWPPLLDLAPVKQA